MSYTKKKRKRICILIGRAVEKEGEKREGGVEVEVGRVKDETEKRERREERDCQRD